MFLSDLYSAAAHTLKSEVDSLLWGKGMTFNIHKDYYSSSSTASGDIYRVALCVGGDEVCHGWLSFIGAFEGLMMIKFKMRRANSMYGSSDGWKEEDIICEASAKCILPRMEYFMDMNRIAAKVMET